MDHSMATGFSSGYGTPIWSSSLTPTSEPQYIGALIGLFILSIGFRGLVAAQGYLEAYLHLHYYPRSTSTLSNSFSRNQPYSRILQDSQDLGSTQIEEKDQNSRQMEGRQSDTLLEKNGDENISLVEETRARNPNSDAGGIQGQGGSLKGRETIATSTSTTTKFRKYQPNRKLYSYDYSDQPIASPLYPLPTVQPFIWQAEVLRAILTTGVIGIGYMLMLVVMTYNSAYFGVILGGVFVGEIYFGRWGRVRPVFPSSQKFNEKRAGGYIYERQDQGADRNCTNGLSPRAMSSSISLSSKTSSHSFSVAGHHDGNC